MEIQVLGPVEVRDNGAEVPLGGPRQRRLLAALVIHAGKVVSVERLIDAVWAGEEPPERAAKTLNTYLSRLRAALGDGLVQKRGPGYSLVVDLDMIDATRFEQLVATARSRFEAGDATEAKVRLDEALALWNGPAYDEFASEPWAWAEASRLEELRLSAREDRAEALRILGKTAEAVGELERLTVELPLRERSRQKLMLALYRDGRQADALRSFQAYRRHLAEEVGLEPSGELAELERMIATRDPRIDSGTAAPAREAHRRRADRALVVPPRLVEIAARGACVGRELPLGQVFAAWKSAVTARERRLVLVAGEPGIGKTRLAGAVAAEVAGDGARVLHGWCDDGVGIAYEAWVHALGGFVQSADDEEIAALAPLAPDLVRCISVVGGRVPDVVARPTTDAASDRARLFDAVDSLLAQITATSPVLLVLDDLHWADPATLGLLRWILSSERGGPMLVLGAYRDTEIDRRHPLSQLLADLRRDARVERVALRGLDEQAIGALLHNRAGHDAPPEFVTALHDETDGNPFFAEEVVAHLVETGAILQRAGVWATDRALTDLGLPESVRDVVGRRLSRLSSETNDLLSVASVVGREFDLSTVAVAAGVTSAVAAAAFDEAARPGLLREVPNTPGGLAFTHALVRQTLLEEISGPRRAHLHWRIGEALAASGNASHGAVAHHLCEGVLAGDALIAAGAAVVASEEAAAIGAFDAANDLAQRAMALIGDASDAPELRCRAILAPSRGWTQVADPGERALVSEAGNLAVEHGWADKAALAAITYTGLTSPGVADPTAARLVRAALDRGADSEWRPALAAMAARLEFEDGVRSDRERAVAEVEAAVAEIEGCNPFSRMLVVDSRWWLRFPDADVDDRKLARDVRIGADALGAMWMLHGFRVELAGSLRHGNRDDFDALFAELAAFTARVGVGHTHVAGVETALALLEGHLADAERLALDALGSLHPDSWVALNTAAQMGSAWSWLGRDDELLNGLVGFATDRRSLQTSVDLWEIAIRARHGERDLRFDRFADDDFESLPRDQFRLAALAGAGAAAVGLRDEGSAAVLEAILQPYHGQFLILPHSLVAFDAADGLRGDLLTVLGRHDEAVACLEAAATLCERARVVPNSIRTAHQLARALAARNGRGDRDRAHALAADAFARATELGMPNEAKAAQAVLDTV